MRYHVVRVSEHSKRCVFFAGSQCTLRSTFIEKCEGSPNSNDCVSLYKDWRLNPHVKPCPARPGYIRF